MPPIHILKVQTTAEPLPMHRETQLWPTQKTQPYNPKIGAKFCGLP